MGIEIIKQGSGRFDRRFRIGPAVWPCFDLLWVHSGAVRLSIGPDSGTFDLKAPGGVLIFPNVVFRGDALGEGSDASVTHFHGGPFEGVALRQGYLTCALAGDTRALQTMVALFQDYARRGENHDVRCRLLVAILDGFQPLVQGRAPLSRLEKLWAEAADKLDRMRSLTDVAALAGLSESALRALHRGEFASSAGRHLQDLRLQTAERLLETTGMSVREIAKAVGYAHPESLSAAFKRSRDCTPLAHRRLCQRLA